MSATSPAQLSYDVFVSDGPVAAGGELMPDGARQTWSPLSSTLIFGVQDALLVDPPFTRTQIQAVGDWVERSGRRLAYIYSTHGHGDHWFGTGELARRFPGATVYATEGTIEVMRGQAGPGRERFDRLFPGQIPETPVLAEPIPAPGFLLERPRLWRSRPGTPTPTRPRCCTCHRSAWSRPGTSPTTACTSTFSKAAAAVCRNGCGPWTGWRLHPRAVVAGHKNKARRDDPAILDETRQYLQDVIRLLDDKPTAREFYDQLTGLYPERLNPGVVWLGARGLLGG